MCKFSRRRTVGRSPVVEVSNRGLNVFGLIPDHGDGIHGRVTERLLAADTSDSLTFEWDGQAVEVFVDGVTAPPDLVIFGTGHDVASVAELATRVDFRVTVTTFRGAVADAERFPAADSVCSTSPADVRDTLSFDATPTPSS